MKTKISNKITTPVLTILALILFGSTIGTAAPGDLDTTFGNGGIVISTGGSINTLEDARGMALQADGKIVAVGYGAAGGSHWDFAVARYNTDGSPDSSFGSSGVVVTPLSNCQDIAQSVAIQADGKIVVTGFFVNSVQNCESGPGHSFAVVRYNPNGSLDTTFNGTGMVITPINNLSSGIARSVAIQADGKIVVAGDSFGNSPGGFTLVRYNTNGSLDTSFDNDGIVVTGVGGAFAVAIQADGKIVAAGSGVIRYNADGSLDTTFNGTGIVTTPDSAYSVVIQADRKILTANGFNSGNRLVRYNANGTLDTSFNGTGSVAVGIFVNSTVVQADGKIVAAGYTEFGEGLAFAVIRLNGNGSLDPTFGGTGTVITPIVTQVYYSSAANAVAIQPDGKIVAAGGVVDIGFDFFDFALVRYQGGSTARFDFDGDGRADISVFRPSDRTWYLNQSTNGFSATQFGLSSDKITPADYDGDGKTDISVYRDGTWYWLSSANNNSFNARPFGIASDIPVPADYTGDGRAELAVYRNGAWWMLDLANNQTSVLRFGLSGDKPVVGDYDGDGKADQAVYRGSGEWHLNRSSQGYTVVNFGLATDKPIVADYDGDGRTDQAVYRDGIWYLLQSTQGFTAFQWGLSSDIPAPADYDGDGRADAAVYRDGVWYLWQSTSGVSIRQFGLTGDKPAPAAYLP